MSYNKKLIEVALPLDAINDASAYDKMPGIGPHPKGLHQWWARLPLPAARAILFSSLIDDPTTNPKFRDLSELEQDAERSRLFEIIRELVDKKLEKRPNVLKKAKAEIKNAIGENSPIILDPFCGGGSIPLEGARLGMTSYGNDLNPISVLITKTMIEFVPRFYNNKPINIDDKSTSFNLKEWKGTQGLSNDVRYYGNVLLKKVEKKIGKLYPKIKIGSKGDFNEAQVISWIWTRTVQCSNPACHGYFPLVRSFALARKKNRSVWIEPIINKANKQILYEVRYEGDMKDSGTVSRKGATCLICNEKVTLEYIRSEGRAGRIKSDLLAIVAEGSKGRLYLSPDEDHKKIALSAVPKWLPDAELPKKHRNFQTPAYGLTNVKDLFTSRQLVALGTFAEEIEEIKQIIIKNAFNSDISKDDTSLVVGGSGANAYSDLISIFLGFAIDRCADFNNSICRWASTNEKVMNLFGRQAIPMVWDYAEANILGNSVGGFLTCLDYIAECIQVLAVDSPLNCKVEQKDASRTDYKERIFLVSTDPPYYDNICYSDLSDFFYVWIRKSLNSIAPSLFSTVLVPKADELVASPHKFDGNKRLAKEHFENGFKASFTRIREIMDNRFPLTVYYAFKQEEEKADDESGSQVDLTTGWETLLEALISSGFQITATWPIRASQKWRMVSMDTNALASYIVLACRVRAQDAPLTTRRDFINTLKKELPFALRKLQHGNIAPVDLAQASIGPGMAVYSRFSKIIESDGSSMKVKTALSIINQILDEVLAEQEGEFDPDSRWAIAWFAQYGMNDALFGEADVLARAKDTSVDGLVQAGILEASRGKVRLLKRDELGTDWDPVSDQRITIWEVTQYLIKRLLEDGESSAAELVKKVGSMAEVSRDLAYRLFTICEKKGWAQEAIPYNSLVVAYPELLRLAQSIELGTQSELFEGI